MLEHDGHGRLAGVGFTDARRRISPELLDGSRAPSVRQGTPARPGTTLVLADRPDDDIADSHVFHDEVTYDCWVTLDMDRAGHLVAIRFENRHSVPPSMRDRPRGGG